MGRVKPWKSDCEHEKSIHLAKKDYLAGIEPSIRSAASTYGLPYSILCDCLQGTQSALVAHHHQQLLTDQEEKSIVRFCNTLDDYGHPVNMRILKGFAKSLLPVSKSREVGKHRATRILNHHPELAVRFSQHLDRQRANASDSSIIKDFFRKVIVLHYN
jgi:hypothetical protein